MSEFRIRVEFKPRDLWVGLYWDRQPYLRDDPPGRLRWRLWRYNVWICLLPCLPIHLWWDGTLEPV